MTVLCPINIVIPLFPFTSENQPRSRVYDAPSIKKKKRPVSGECIFETYIRYIALYIAYKFIRGHVKVIEVLWQTKFPVSGWLKDYMCPIYTCIHHY